MKSTNKLSFNKALVIVQSATIFSYNYAIRVVRSISFADLAISKFYFLALFIKPINFIEAPFAIRLVSFRRLPPKGAAYLMANTDYVEKSSQARNRPKGCEAKGPRLGVPIYGFTGFERNGLGLNV